ncbi:hypothetical protein [Afipia felis]|jgi:hypothetical protein|nr:hypothetical protein [Afipia felis]
MLDNAIVEKLRSDQVDSLGVNRRDHTLNWVMVQTVLTPIP